MSVSAQLVETITDTAGSSRETIRRGYVDISVALGDRLEPMQQRVSVILANPSHGATSYDGLDAVLDVTESILPSRDKAQIFGSLGLGFLGGLLVSGAAGQSAVIPVGLLCLFGTGMLLLSYAKALIARLSDSLDAF